MEPRRSRSCRKEPLTAFRLEWYDPATSTIHVPATAMKGRGDSYRPLDVPISRWAASCLDGIGRSTGYAWPNPITGTPQGGFFGVEKKLSELAGLPAKFSLHALRGTFNTWLAEHRCEKHTAEVPFFVREKLMGHAIPAQVDAYTNFDVGMMEAVSVIDCIHRQHTKGTVVPMRKRMTA